MFAELGSVPMNLKFEKELGYGFQGYVLQVRDANRSYALKIYRINKDQSAAVGIAIQKALGDLELAPKILAFSSGVNLLRLKHELAFEVRNIYPEFERADLKLAVLMELTDDRSLKVGRGIPNYGRSARANLLAQAREINDILKQLNIYPMDLDAVIEPEGMRLKLIDLTSYRMGPMDELCRGRLEDLVYRSQP